MSWGVIVQRPNAADQIPGYSEPFQANPELSTPTGSGQTITSSAPRTLSVNIRENNGNCISAQHGNPIGQVFFVPREPLTLRPGSDEEVAAFGAKVEQFRKDKAADMVETPYGWKYSRPTRGG